MASTVTNYKCPACTGPLRYDGTTEKMVCDYCDSTFSVDEIKAMYGEADQQAEQQFVQEEKDATWKAEQETWNAAPEGMRAYSCPSCGAELICDSTTAATRCPYCDNVTIVPGQLGGTLKPDYIIPFKLDKEAAVAALKKHYEKKRFLPNAFTSHNRVEDIQGVYVPFWLFDGTADADISYHGTRTFAHRAGNYEVIDTDHFHVRRSGKVSFARIPVDGSSKMPDDYMDSIEPFNYEELKDFNNAYLAGFVADKYDVTAEDSNDRANRRLIRSAKDVLRNDVQGYESVVETNSKVEVIPGEVHYALMPVWMLTTNWNGQKYLFAMNGQTGKLVGDLPVDRGKYWRTFAAITAGVAAFLLVTGIGRGIAQIFGSLFS